MQKKESTDLPLLKKQLAETEKGINNMLNAIQAGIFTPSTKQRLDELEETKSQLEVSILQEEMHKPLLTREQIAFFIYRFRKFDVTKREQRQRLIDSFVNAVYLYEDKIILIFNYKDGSKTITLAEVEGSDLSVLGAPDLRSAIRNELPATFLSCGSTISRVHFVSPLHVGMDYAPFKIPSHPAGDFSYRSVVPPLRQKSRRAFAVPFKRVQDG